MPHGTLRELFEAHEGKTCDKWDSYLDVYEEVFAPFRDKPISLLEFGVQNGGSLEVWARYFRKAKVVVGVDIDPRCAALSFQDARISVVIGDATAAKTRDEIACHSSLFDIIIDDGSHASSDIIATFLRVIPLLANNGVYLVEDMHASYWKEFGGELFAPYSAAAFFKTLTDVLNAEHWSLNIPAGELLQPFARRVQVPLPVHDLERIKSVAFFNSLCVIKKTGGERVALGPRRIAGTRSEVTSIVKFTTESFARKDALETAEDYVWAWQPRPPMETLAAKTRLAAMLQVEHDALRQELEEKDRELTLQRKRLAEMRRSLSWRITRPLRFTKRLAKGVYRRMRAIGPRLSPSPLSPGANQSADWTGLSQRRTYGLTEWLEILGNHFEEQSAEMQEHINAMLLRPNFLVVVDARKDDRDIDATLASLRVQNYGAAKVAILRRLSANETPLGLQIEGDDVVQHVNELDLTDPKFGNLDWALFLEPGDRLVPWALYTIASVINREPKSAMIYSDELLRASDGAPFPFYKPAWSPDYLESFDYIGHSGVFSMERIRKLSLPFASVYDLTLRFTEDLRPDSVLHLDQILFERGAPFDQPPAGVAEAIRGRLERTGRKGAVVPASSGTNCYHARLSWERRPEVSIVIPTAGRTRRIGGREVDLIVNVTQQIVERSTYRTPEIVVVSNSDLNEAQSDHLAKLGCKVLAFEEPTFNFSKEVNIGADAAGGELLLLLNDDIEIAQEDWIERLCDHVAKPEVGVVGCKLLYPNRRIQHVGVVQGHGNPDHVRRGYRADDAGYFNSTCGVRNYLAVTGACMLTRKALYKQVGGYTPRFAVSYNDVDYCLKVRAAGYRVVYTGDVSLIHMESSSRVPSADPEEVRCYHRTWTPELPSDPFYNERCMRFAPPSFEPQINARLF